MLVVVVVVVFMIGCADPPSAARPTATATGTTPNDLVLSSCEGERVALVTASGDARLDVLSLDEAPARAVFLDDGSQPWMVDVVGPSRAVVSLFGSNEVALVSPCDQVVLSRVSAATVVDVSPPVTWRVAEDVDGDGIDDVIVSRMVARSPQAVVVVGAEVFVTYSNLLALSVGGEPMLSGPGLLARFRLSPSAAQADELSFVDAVRLPCENPGGMVGNGEHLVVGCSGRFLFDGGGTQRASAGGIVVVDVGTFAVTASITLADFSAGTPALHGDTIVVGNLLGGELRRYDLSLALLDSVVLGDANESIFSVVNVLQSGSDADVGAALFLAGTFVVSPFGAATTLQVAAEGPARGLIDVAIDDDDGSALGLLTLSAELVRVELP